MAEIQKVDSMLKSSGGGQSKALTLEEKVEWENSIEGNLKGYNCNICKNRGYISVILNDTIAVKKCSCMKIRNTLNNLSNCGITNETFNRYSFDKFTTNEEWQKKLKARVLKYLDEAKSGSKKWLVLSGISGCGKTHLCASVLKELILSGKNGKYLMWKEFLDKIKPLKKSNYTDNIEKFEDLMREIKTVDVLYIDDFLKLMDAYSRSEDLNIAYEIINGRYNNNLITIISTENKKTEIEELDFAIFGRIYEQAKENWLELKYEKERNYRIRKGEEI